MVAVMRLPVGPHPHSHGENGMFTPPVYSFAGSSPLTRGKLDPQSDQRNAHGLIPAHAGKTFRLLFRRVRGRAHPRSRGENHGVESHTIAHGGSSPLTRGKRARAGANSRAHGLIPAHAGKTIQATRRRRRAWAHPRSRGENHGVESHTIAHGGSSPLTRGKRGFAGGADEPAGLIPAHAGKTRASTSA